jgi:hypothetical protein
MGKSVLLRLLGRLLSAWLTAHVMLWGGIGLARRWRLGGLIGGLLRLIDHSISFRENLKSIFQVLHEAGVLFYNYNSVC